MTMFFFKTLIRLSFYVDMYPHGPLDHIKLEKYLWKGNDVIIIIITSNYFMVFAGYEIC